MSLLTLSFSLLYAFFLKKNKKTTSPSIPYRLSFEGLFLKQIGTFWDTLEHFPYWKDDPFYDKYIFVLITKKGKYYAISITKIFVSTRS